MDLHVSSPSNSYDSVNNSLNTQNSPDLHPQGTSYQQFAAWLRRCLESLKKPADCCSVDEILSNRLGITLAFAQLLLSGYVRPNATLMKKLLIAFPDASAHKSFSHWTVSDTLSGVTRLMDINRQPENQNTSGDDLYPKPNLSNRCKESNKSPLSHEEKEEEELPIKLRGFGG